jgi:redox-sensitive bicupin YhaK (pirin superfamily)
MGPLDMKPGRGFDVRPHPHIGLATVTYLFDGEIFHRDSVGSALAIQPGAVNWMTAGRGIAHSERSAPETRARGGRMFGMQSWVALPKKFEETEPGFAHHPASSLPVVEGQGVTVRLIAGELFGASAPVQTLSDMFYADVTLAAGARVELPAGHEERAAYTVDGTISVDGGSHGAGQLLVFKPGATVTLQAGAAPARVMLLGGEPMDGPRHIWWNFVSSSPERIEQAKADWRAGRFAPVPDETDFVPLPG